MTSHVRCMFDLLSVKFMDGQFAGSTDEIVQVGTNNIGRGGRLTLL